MAKYQLFADEAWTHNSEPLSRYHYFFGGIFGFEQDMDKLDTELRKIILKHKVKTEIKWSKISPKYLDCYKELIDCLSIFILNHNIKYRQMFKDRSYHFNVPNELSELDVQFRLYYQFLKHSFGFEYLPKLEGKEKHEILLRLDGHSSQKHKDKLENFMTRVPTIFNRDDIDIKVTYIDSSKFARLQVCDLFMGAAGYKGNRIHDRRHSNKRGMTRSQKIKLELANYIYDKLKEIDNKDRGKKAFLWFESTGTDGDKINKYNHKMRIWKFVPAEYIKNKGWERKNLTSEGYWRADIFE